MKDKKTDCVEMCAYHEIRDGRFNAECCECQEANGEYHYDV